MALDGLQLLEAQVLEKNAQAAEAHATSRREKADEAARNAQALAAALESRAQAAEAHAASRRAQADEAARTAAAVQTELQQATFDGRPLGDTTWAISKGASRRSRVTFRVSGLCAFGKPLAV